MELFFDVALAVLVLLYAGLFAWGLLDVFKLWQEQKPERRITIAELIRQEREHGRD